MVVRALGGGAGSVTRVIGKARMRKVKQALARLESDANNLLLPALSELSAKFRSDDMIAVGKFLGSIEADTFVRSVAIAVLSKEYERLAGDLRDEAAALLVLTSGLDAHIAADVGLDLLNVISKYFRQAAKELANRAPDLYGRVVDRAIADKNSGYLHSLADRNRRFGRLNAQDLVEVVDFVGHYRRSLHARTSDLIPAYFDIQKRVPIDSLYVPPRFRRADDSDAPWTSAAHNSLDEFLSTAYRSVVLGDPGAGKSTLAQKLAYDFSGSDQQTEGAVVPFVVSLRAYEEMKRGQHCSLIDFLVANLRENYHIKASTSVIEYVLLSGRAFAIFDGLDELLDITRRKEMSAAVESFADLYSATTVVVTSRAIGYYEAPLNPVAFSSDRLMNFASQDVEFYVTNWFNIDERLDASESARVASAFLQESTSVPDLRSNALMLGLLCNVYRGIRTIPRNRADLYEKCAEMLFEQWDAGRGIMAPGPLKADAKSALQDVALWVYTTEDLGGGVPHRLLEGRLAKFWQRRYEEPEAAVEAAKKLVKLWKGRTWVLSDVGSTVYGEELLYKFTHQTFLEYFAAAELVRRSPSPQKLWNILEPNIKVGGWDIVSQLAIQKLEASYLDAGDSVVRLLIKSARKSRIVERANLLSFASRNLDGLYVRPKTCRGLTRIAVDLFFEGMSTIPSIPDYEDYQNQVLSNFEERLGSSTIEEELDDEDGDDGQPEDIEEDRTFGPDEVATPLLRMIAFGGELRRAIHDEVRNHCLACIARPDLEVAGKAFLLLARSEEIVIISQSMPEVHEMSDIGTSGWEVKWNEDRRTRSFVQGKIAQWSSVNFWIPIVACRSGLISLQEMFALSGLHALICTMEPFPGLTVDVTTVSFLEVMLRAYLGLPGSSHFDVAVFPSTDTLAALSLVGRRLGCQPGYRFDLDWFSKTSLQDDIIHADFTRSEYNLFESEEVGGGGELFDVDAVHFSDPDAIFGAAVLLGVVIEQENWSLYDYSGDQVSALRLGPLQPIESVFISRIISGFEYDAELALEATNLSIDQKQTLHEWSRRRLRFTKPKLSSWTVHTGLIGL